MTEVIMELELDLADAVHVSLDHFWSRVVGAGRANEGLRAHWQSQLTQAHRLGGFDYVRFHGLFHGDMFVYREIDGDVVPSFHYVDLLFDAILAAGMRPFVEFGFSPAELARETGTVFWWGANGAPPTDNEKWAALVRATVEHWVARYGIDEVRAWYFEVWNEPNLGPFFRGTRSEYFELYRVTVRAVKAVDPALRVGGPATSNFVPDARFDGEVEDVAQHEAVLTAPDLDALDWQPVWLEEFLRFCADNRLPVDFVSCHPYPTDWALDGHGNGRKLTRGVEATPTDLRRVREIVDAGPYPRAEIHLTEWSSSSSSRDFTHDYPQAAAFVVRTVLASIGLVDSLAYWTFTDVFEEEGAGRDPFHGGFGMLNQDGIPKPTMHAYRMLNALGDHLVHREEGLVVTRRGSDVTALAVHYPEEVTLSVPASFGTRDVADRTLATGQPKRLSLRIAGLVASECYTLEVVDDRNGWAMTEWTGQGRNGNPSRADIDAIRTSAEHGAITRHTVSDDGVLEVDAPLRPWAIALLSRAR
ncbi:GH39 family glycosyl hydrolase [Streptomyces sp. NBC_00343]|uniref:GH39 family glycosyl hydrolase n=1 Tax=Streptomyces sp. NBC_00343 TaxID=2975719 RepID=UPI002E2C20CE|nr:beta-xylosidase [Streptomyces sp. NBC_00343]